MKIVIDFDQAGPMKIEAREIPLELVEATLMRALAHISRQVLLTQMARAARAEEQRIVLANGRMG